MVFPPTIQELPDSMSITFAITLIVITVLSSIFSSIIPITYFIFKRCQGHPTKLIAIICLIDLILGYNLVLISLNIYNIQSGFHLEQIFAILTLHFKFHPSDVGFCTLNLSLFVILQTLSLCFNLCLAFDLIVTLTKPFLSGKSREIFYYIGSVLVTIGAFLTMTKYVQEQCIDEKDDQDLIISDFRFPYPMVGMMLLFECVALLTVVWALIELYSKKKTIEAKSSYIKQHVWVLVSLMVCYIAPCLNNFLQIFHEKNLAWSKYVRNISFISLLVNGSLVNIVRLMDPYVRKNVLFVWNRIRSCNFSKIENEAELEHDEWNGSLNDFVVQFQNQSIIQNILFVVQEVSLLQEEGLLGGSIVQMNRDEINSLLYGGEEQDLSKAVKLKKTLRTYCVEYKNDVKDFRATAIHFQNFNRQQEELEKSKHFKIKATALSYYIFQKIRMMDGLNDDELSRSLDLEKNAESIKKTRESLGASGSFFFFSYDKRLIIKTITSQEQECLLSFLPEYYLYLHKNPYTLLAKIYGIYNIEIGKSSKIIFLLMENSFKSFQNKKLDFQIYDIKGSLVKREVKNPSAMVLKDVNFLKSNKPFILMTQAQKTDFIAQVKKDITLLAQQNIMDYSLLAGISNVDDNYVKKQGNWRNWKWMDSTHSIDKKIYSLSIIDYLQKFNCQKQMELRYKTFFSPNLDVSCIDPVKYFNRYIAFLEAIIVTVNQ